MQSSPQENVEPLDPRPVTRQPLDYQELHEGLSFVNGRRKVPTRGVAIGISAFVKSGVMRTSDQEFS
jgi:hypothetical protein